MLEIAFILKFNGNYLQTVWEGFQCVQIRPGWFRQRLLCCKVNLWVFTWLQQLLAICHWVWKKSVQSPGKYRLFLVAVSMQSYFYSSVTELLDCVWLFPDFTKDTSWSQKKRVGTVSLFFCFIYLFAYLVAPTTPTLPNTFNVSPLIFFSSPPFPFRCTQHFTGHQGRPVSSQLHLLF